jgi:hypothetical protein
MNSEAATVRDPVLKPILEAMWEMPLRDIAQELNHRKIVARRGGIGDACHESLVRPRVENWQQRFFDSIGRFLAQVIREAWRRSSTPQSSPSSPI